MKVGEGCYPCLVGQARGVLELVDPPDREVHMERAMAFLEENYGPDEVPAVLGSRLHHLLAESMGDPDPFREMKAAANRTVLGLLDRARELIQDSPDPLAAGFRVAMAGNLIDLGVYRENPPLEELMEALEDRPVIDHTHQARELLAEPGDVLYLLDNAGEVVLDRLLIELLVEGGHRVTAAVKSGPIVNDATISDARAAGIDRVARVIETGNNYVGVVEEESSPEFLDAFRRADAVIAKGQASYETLDEYLERPIIFLFKAKCTTVAGALGVPQKSSVVLLNLSHHKPG
ncbi:MAG: DUF89 family protein [Euryarchaeota archaeon]|nr:DUF89 family protein [Euryarchaeota archaeon]